jgi:hypothetical protein
MGEWARVHEARGKRRRCGSPLMWGLRLAAGVIESCLLIIATSLRPCETRVVALIAGRSRGWVGGLRIGGVEERYQHAFFHQFVDFSYSLV